MKPILKNITDALLLNAYTVQSPGLIHGKTGIALSLFVLARQFEEELFENHAFDLFQEVFTYENGNPDFEYGRAGISYALQFLINHNYLNADFSEIYGKQQTDIINHIKQLEYSENSIDEYIDYLFFVHKSGFITQTDRKNCIQLLKNFIIRFLEDIENEFTPHTVNQFYSRTSKLLPVLYPIQKEIFYRIESTANKLSLSDYTCTDPLFAFNYMVYGINHNASDVIREGKFLVENLQKDIFPPFLTFRQRIDIIACIKKIYDYDNRLDFRKTANELLISITDVDGKVFERKVNGLIRNETNLMMGIGYGLSRLLLLEVYLNGTGKSSDIYELFVL